MEERKLSASDGEPATWVGEEVGGLRLDRELGAGGMGRVWRARDPRLERFVAVKFLAAHLASEPEFVTRFEREARALSAVRHPSVAQIYSSGEWRGLPYFVMEYVEGESLAALAATTGALPWPRVLRWFVAVAEGLSAAHAVRVIHRDIKPSNLLVDRDGEPKIVDFGLARRIGVDATITASDRALGTPFYMSPEQALGKTVDHRSDIYSLGATMYHLLAGAPPFAGATPLAVLLEHLNTPAPPLAAQHVAVPPALAAVVDRCLAKSPDARFPDYGSLLAKLRALDPAREPTRADPGFRPAARAVGTRAPAATDAPSPALRRSAPLAAIVAGGAALVLVALIVAELAHRDPSSGATTDNRPGTAAPRSAASPPRRSRFAAAGAAATAPRPEPPATDSAALAPSESEDPPGATPRESATPGGAASVSGELQAVAAAAAARAQTLLRLQRLRVMVEVWRTEHDALPPSLDALVERDPSVREDLADAWGRAVEMRPLPNGDFRIVSAGPDGVFGTADDLDPETPPPLVPRS